MEKLSSYKITEMYSYWVEKQSERYVARMCHVSKNTVHKYRLKGRWDDRLRNIKKRAHEIVYNKGSAAF